MMTFSPLLAICPLDGRYQEKTATLNGYFSEYALFKYRLFVEIKWFIALGKERSITEVPAFSPEAEKFLIHLFDNFSLEDAEEIKTLEKTTNHDVKAVEYFLKEKIKDHQELAPYAEFIHFACTSEDINNLAYALLFKEAKNNIVHPMMIDIIASLSELAKNHAEVPMLARTHGQPASPTTVGKEIANFIYRLENASNSFLNTRIHGKMNGAVGNFNAHFIAYPEVDWVNFSKELIESLDITWNPYTTQIENHDYLSEHFSHLTRFNSILVDFARDTWGYISLGYFSQKMLAHETGSSTMPHKINPIDFENAEGNLLMSNAVLNFLAQQLLTSRWQRDLVDSTLMRNLGVGVGYGYIAYQSLLKGIKKLSVNTALLNQDLENHWEVLGEAIQTVMRRYGLPQPYEQLKKLTRGQNINEESLRTFILGLGLPDTVTETLLRLTPSQYIGNASEMAKKI